MSSPLVFPSGILFLHVPLRNSAVPLGKKSVAIFLRTNNPSPKSRTNVLVPEVLSHQSVCGLYVGYIFSFAMNGRIFYFQVWDFFFFF